MTTKLNLNSKELLDHVFTISNNGYNSLEVDSFLDTIIRDYRFIEDNVLISKSAFELMERKISEYEMKNRELEIENKRYKARFEGLKTDENVSLDNLDLLKRIRSLEKFLWKEGYNPNNIK